MTESCRAMAAPTPCPRRGRRRRSTSSPTRSPRSPATMTSQEVPRHENAPIPVRGILQYPHPLSQGLVLARAREGDRMTRIFGNCRINCCRVEVPGPARLSSPPTTTKSSDRSRVGTSLRGDPAGVPGHPGPVRVRVVGKPRLLRARDRRRSAVAVEPAQCGRYGGSRASPPIRPQTSKRRARWLVFEMMPNRTELLSVPPDVTPLIRPSRISAQLRVQGRISLSEVLSALSCALDLTEGAPAGTHDAHLPHRHAHRRSGRHSTRSSGRRSTTRSCSRTPAARATRAGWPRCSARDDRSVKPRMKSVDWHERVRLAARDGARGGAGTVLPRSRLRQFVTDRAHAGRDARADRGSAAIAARRSRSSSGFPEATARRHPLARRALVRARLRARDSRRGRSRCSRASPTSRRRSRRSTIAVASRRRIASCASAAAAGSIRRSRASCSLVAPTIRGGRCCAATSPAPSSPPSRRIA